MESGKIPNGGITASSTKTGYDAWKGRLNGNSCWMPTQNSNSEYITVRFATQVTVVAVATQGAPIESCWVKSYIIRYGVQMSISQDPKVKTSVFVIPSLITRIYSNNNNTEV